jgi:hypothetical protein
MHRPPVLPPRRAGITGDMPPKTQREREAEQRQLKLDRMKEQVDEGTLVIRKMTDEERARFEKKRAERVEAPGQKRRSRPRKTARPGRPIPKPT